MSHYCRSRTVPRLLAVFAVAACQSVAPIPDPIAFTFQGGSVSTAIMVSVRNTGDDVVFLPRCGEQMLPAIERRSEDAWVNTAADICPASLRADPIRLEVGAVHQDSVVVMQPGTYRIRLGIWRRSTTAPSESVVSQSFAAE